MVISMRTHTRLNLLVPVLVLVGLLGATVCLAQKPASRPKVHSDFVFGSFPVSRDADTLMSKDKNRFMIVAFHEGWDFDKIGKELKISDEEVDKLFSVLDEEKLAAQNQDNDPRPLMTVVREKDIERIKGSLQKNTQEFTRIMEGNWPYIESMAASLNGARGIPKEQLMYQIVVSGILLGGMIDTFYEDKTLIPPGPRRGRGQRYFAWLVEGDGRYAGRIQREESTGDGYAIVTVGAKLAALRPGMDQIRADRGMVLDEAESRRLRSFINILCKDKLLPYFKNSRNDLIKVAAQMSSSKYSSFGEFLAWYYNQVADNTVDELVASRRIQPPADQYAYAVKSLQ